MDLEKKYEDALDWIHGLGRFGIKPGLERVTALLDKLGNPHLSLKFVHIGGTNGKGSTAVMLTSILRAAGYKVGLYTSPYLLSFTNRMAVNGDDIDRAELVSLVEEVRPVVDLISEDPELGDMTEFEVVTVLALCYFARQNTDLVVLEVGLGGRLDATNVITPLISVITNISLEHTDILGDTIEKIAFEKAGIIKAGKPLVTAAADERALGVFEKRCSELGSPMYRVYPFSAVSEAVPENRPIALPGKITSAGQCFSYKGFSLQIEDLFIPLRGSYQLDNAATALAAAEMLRAKGYDVHVYDRYDRVGGLMIYGIPNFKLEKSVVNRRTEQLIAQGIKFHLNYEIGRDASFAELRERHDAVLIATGVYKAREAPMPGIGLTGVTPALDFLTASNRKGLGDKVVDFDNGTLNAEGKNVVVIGGGDTAMDCVRTAVRQGAAAVTCLYRRNRANMPGSQREVNNAEEEGVVFEWLAAPEAILGDDKVTAVRAVRMHLGMPDATGRQMPEPVADSSYNIDADLAIMALGFDPEDLPGMFGMPQLPVSRWGTVSVSWATMMTKMDGVFAAGDIVRGASLVVWGIRDGRDAAASIHQYLKQKARVGDLPMVAAE